MEQNNLEMGQLGSTKTGLRKAAQIEYHVQKQSYGDRNVESKRSERAIFISKKIRERHMRYQKRGVILDHKKCDEFMEDVLER